MKKIFFIVLLTSFNSYANDNGFILTKSNQGSFFTFEDATEVKADNFILEVVETENEKTYIFKQKKVSIDTPSYWYATSDLTSTSNLEAENICQNITYGGTNWRSPTTDEVKDAISSGDPDFIDVMNHLGNETYLARGFINGGSYIFSNQTQKGIVYDDSSLVGQYPTLCVRD